MSRRQQLIRESKNKTKNLISREQDKAYRILIFSMIVGALNYIFWHDQFVGLDFKYTILFIVVPLILGVFFYWSYNKNFVGNILGAKASSWWDTVLSNFLLGITALLFAYFSLVTVANIIFKLSIDFSVRDKPIIYKTYKVKSTRKNDIGRGIHLFSTIYYSDEANETKAFQVGVDAVETSFETRKITFKCLEGFWGYCKIIDYTME